MYVISEHNSEDFSPEFSPEEQSVLEFYPSSSILSTYDNKYVSTLQIYPTKFKLKFVG